MKNSVKSAAVVICGVLVFATIAWSAHGGVTVTYNPVASSYGPPPVWPGVSLVSILPTNDIYGDQGFGADALLGETFLATNSFTLGKIHLVGNGDPGSGSYTLHLYSLGPGGTWAAYNNPFNPGSYTDLLSSPTFTPASSSKSVFEFAFSGADQAVIVSGNNYFFALEWNGAGANSLIWERNTGGTLYTNGASYKGSTSSVNDSVFGSGIRPLIMEVEPAPQPPTNAVVVYNPAGSSYGPPPVWPGLSYVSILPFANAYGDQGFGANTVMGESFLATNSFTLGRIHLAGSGDPASGSYTLHLFNLGSGGTWAAYLNSFNPGLYPDLLSPVTFTPTNSSKGIIEFTFAGQNQVPIISGNNYFFALEWNGSGNNGFIWERNSGGTLYTNGASYAGSLTAVDDYHFGSGIRPFIMDVEGPPPPPVTNLDIAVIASPPGNSWPGSPTVVTFSDPSLPAGGTRVAEGFDSPAGRVVSMSFVPAANLTLGSVSIRGAAGGNSNAVFFVALYAITNNAGGTGYPSNYLPQLQATSLLRSNLCFQLTNASSNDVLISLSFTNPLDQVPLLAGTNYAFEVWRDTNNAGTNALLWVRGSSGISTYGTGFPLVPRGFEATSGNGNSQPLSTPSNLRTPLAGGKRDLVMAVYPVQTPTITISNIIVTAAGAVTFNWNSIPGSTYTVLKKFDLNSPLWITNVTGYPVGGALGNVLMYGELTGNNPTAFYRVTTP